MNTVYVVNVIIIIIVMKLKIRESGVIVLFCLVERRETVPLPEIWFQVKLC